MLWSVTRSEEQRLYDAFPLDPHRAVRQHSEHKMRGRSEISPTRPLRPANRSPSHPPRGMRPLPTSICDRVARCRCRTTSLRANHCAPSAARTGFHGEDRELVLAGAHVRRFRSDFLCQRDRDATRPGLDKVLDDEDTGRHDYLSTPQDSGTRPA